MHIGIFSDSINIPPKEGINVHTYDLLLSLSLRADTNVTLFVCDRGWLDHTVLASQPFDTVLIPEADFYSVQNVAALLKEYSIDIAQSYMTYFGAVVLGPAGRLARTPIVAELHDLEESVVGLYFERHELAQALRDHVTFQKSAAAYASLVRMMSLHDYGVVKSTWSDFSSDRYFWMPVSQPTTETHHQQTSNLHRLLYVGNMSYAPNAEGAELICRELVPHLDRDVTFVGRGSDTYSRPGVEGLGMVDDIDSLLRETVLGLSPILHGSGMKIKNLTYLRYGIPVLTTTVGARGYPSTEAIIVEDDLAKWPEIISSIVNDKRKRAMLSHIARKYFTEHFDIDANTDALVRRYQYAVAHYAETAHMLPQVMRQEIDLRHVYWLRELRESSGDKVSRATLVKGGVH